MPNEVQKFPKKSKILKIRGTDVQPAFFETLYFQVEQKCVPSNFWVIGYWVRKWI